MSVPQPLFILAAPRSFTSIICTMLGQHPQAYGVPELNLFLAEVMGDLPQNVPSIRQLNGLFRTVSQLYAGEQTIESVDMAVRWFLRRSDRPTAEVYWELCRQVAPLKIVDKSPAYSLFPKSLQHLGKTFPDAHYIHLLRHPKPQGESVMKLAGGAIAIKTGSIDRSTTPPTVDPQYLWYRIQSNILEFLRTVPAERQIRLRGEDVLNEPQLYFEKICRWLDFTWNESVFQAMLHPQDSPFACLGPYGATLGNDPNFIKSPTYRYRTINLSDLEGPLPWRNDNKGFLSPVLKLARELGYN